MPAGPKTHPDTEKALRLVNEKGYTCYKAAGKYGLSPSTVYKAFNKKKKKASAK